jgi:hypothetical protein
LAIVLILEAPVEYLLIQKVRANPPIVTPTTTNALQDCSNTTTTICQSAHSNQPTPSFTASPASDKIGKINSHNHNPDNSKLTSPDSGSSNDKRNSQNKVDTPTPFILPFP